MVKDWPDGAPEWEPYLCWQVGRSEQDAIEWLKESVREEFRERHGREPEFVFYRLRAIYAGPVKRRTS